MNGLIVICKKLGTICRNIREASTGAVVDSTIGTDVRRSIIGVIIWQAGVVCLEVVGYSTFLIIWSRKIVGKSA